MMVQINTGHEQQLAYTRNANIVGIVHCMSEIFVVFHVIRSGRCNEATVVYPLTSPYDILLFPFSHLSRCLFCLHLFAFNRTNY